MMPSDAEWMHITVSLGVLDLEGTRRIMVMIQSEVYFDTVIPWCHAADPAARTIVQGVTFQQSMLISPIEVRAGALPVKLNQKVRTEPPAHDAPSSLVTTTPCY